MIFCHTFHAWGYTRPPSCSGTAATILVLGNYPDHHRARGLSRPPSYSGTVQTIIVRGDSSARGLPRPLSDHCSETALLGYM